jgi:predicted methyltransferase
VKHQFLKTTVLAAALLTALSTPADEPKRSDEDLARDQNSKPFAVLDFMGVQPGWRVIDLFAGNGYYSEVLAQRVGAAGKVYLHNNQAFMGFANKLNARVKDNRLANVEVFVREVEDINLPSNSLDMALIVMAYHDAYFEQNGWTVTADRLFAVIHRILKPGGVLAVIDHKATPGSGKTHAQNLHRIDPEFARQDIESRGFTLVDSSNLLENPSDDLSVSVFDPAIRGRTSRFIYKFVKPTN